VTPVRGGLLRDLALLVKRHPSREWLLLARLLEDENTRSQLISVFKGVGKLAGSRGSARAGAAPPSSGKSPHRHDVYSREKFELDLSRSAMAELRDIARSYGIPFSIKDSRQRLRKRILALAQGGEMKIRDRFEPIGKKVEGDYAQWADIIIRGPRPRR
jgi:hypothetical protein